MACRVALGAALSMAVASAGAAPPIAAASSPSSTPSSTPPAGTWAVAGRQGVLQVVIVPPAQAGDEEAYLAQIARLCAPSETCFVNFHTNSTGAPLAVPLPDAIAAEPTARYRRSMKMGGARLLQWSCRVRPADPGCF